MTKINLQKNAVLLIGNIEYYWFENKNIGLKKTLFHRITFPIKPINTRISYVPQPENTSIVIEWLKLNLDDPSNLDNVEISSKSHEDVEASIYIGAAHNIIDIITMKFKRVKLNMYNISAALYVDFENEGVAVNETFVFQVKAKYTGEA